MSRVTNQQYTGILKMVISMLEEGEPREEIIKRLKELINEK